MQDGKGRNQAHRARRSTDDRAPEGWQPIREQHLHEAADDAARQIQR